jgi:hypothetical protein
MSEDRVRAAVRGVLRCAIPKPLRPAARQVWNGLSSPLRRSPSFIIIGAQRAGTTSLYRYLTAHPRVLPAAWKEIHYFDRSYHRGAAWYRAHFRFVLESKDGWHFHRAGTITGEASPEYLFDPRVPERVRRDLPGVKLIALLRNPVDRAISHFAMESSERRTELSLEEALRRESERLPRDIQRPSPGARCEGAPPLQLFSYLARGVYVDQLVAWERYFPRGQLLVINSGEFFADPAAAMGRVWRFIDLPEVRLSCYPAHSAFVHPCVDSATRAALVEYFRPHNRRLYEFLGCSFDWDR